MLLLQQDQTFIVHFMFVLGETDCCLEDWAAYQSLRIRKFANAQILTVADLTAIQF